MYGDEPFHVTAQIVQKMPAVGDLHRVGRTVAGAIGVSTGAVPADDLHAGVGAQPVGEVGGFSAQEHIDGSVCPSARSISTVPYWWPRRSANSSTPRTVTWPTGGSGMPRIHRSTVDRLTPIPRLVASREPGRPASANYHHQRNLRARAAAGVPLGQLRHLLDEGAGVAVAVVAEEPADRQPQFYRLAGNWQIRQMTLVTASTRVDTRPHRRHRAPRAPRMRGDHHPAVDQVDSIDHRRHSFGSRIRQQHPPATSSRAPHRADPTSALDFTESGPEPNSSTIHSTPGV